MHLPKISWLLLKLRYSRVVSIFNLDYYICPFLKLTDRGNLILNAEISKTIGLKTNFGFITVVVMINLLFVYRDDS